MKILLIEDDREAAADLADALDRSGREVVSTFDGVEALHELDEPGLARQIGALGDFDASGYAEVRVLDFAVLPRDPDISSTLGRSV